jgi:hypothetical protein
MGNDLHDKQSERSQEFGARSQKVEKNKDGEKGGEQKKKMFRLFYSLLFYPLTKTPGLAVIMPIWPIFAMEK